MVAAHAVGFARWGDPIGGIYQQLICEFDLGDHIENRRFDSYTLPWEDNKEVRSQRSRKTKVYFVRKMFGCESNPSMLAKQLF